MCLLKNYLYLSFWRESTNVECVKTFTNDVLKNTKILNIIFAKLHSNQQTTLLCIGSLLKKISLLQNYILYFSVPCIKKQLNFSEILKLSSESRKEAWTRERGLSKKGGTYPNEFYSISYSKFFTFIQLDQISKKNTKVQIRQCDCFS